MERKDKKNLNIASLDLIQILPRAVMDDSGDQVTATLVKSEVTELLCTTLAGHAGLSSYSNWDVTSQVDNC